ncbi:hypothetical protein C8A03DRAFT_37545 [Achaetomium macrosporum]|uniref:Ankyrin n=1 Tax=Achaetomium macrosporum TaxID=79813 RepID=A0AAN7C3E9_9PEZI|nr:hypothetical protein C8A03DRAFT_37545 [Achaetomium macrosporum]
MSLLRGRRKRRNGRLKLIRPELVSFVSLSKQSQTEAVPGGESDTVFTIATSVGSEISSYLAGRCPDRADFSILAKKAILWPQDRIVDGSDSELLVLPIHRDDGDGQSLGYLIFPKNVLMFWAEEPWEIHIASNGEDLDVGRLYILGNIGVYPTITTRYWGKFFVEAFDEFIGIAAANRALSKNWSESYSAAPDLPNQEVTDDDTFIESEYHFALLLTDVEAKAEREEPSDTYSEKTELPKLIGEQAACQTENIRNFSSLTTSTCALTCAEVSRIFYLTRELFYGARYFSAIPQAYQAKIVEHVTKIATNCTHPTPIRAHAVLELAICRLSGFGVDRDVDKGLEWLRNADHGAQAVVRRLHRAYGRMYAESMAGIECLIRDARYGSYWAFEELMDQDQPLYEKTLRDAVFHHPTAGDAPQHYQNVPGSDAQLFWAAAMTGQVDIVRYLVSERVSVETRHNGQTPPHTAVLHGEKDVLEFLLQNGANVHALTSDKGMSVMYLLSWTPKPVGTELFMLDELHRRLGDVTGGSGRFGKMVQPIHIAALNSRVKALERLIELGADPTIPIGEDITPCIRGYPRHADWKPEIVEDLIHSESISDQARVSIKRLTPAGIALARYDMLCPTEVLAMLRILILAQTAPKSNNNNIPASSVKRLYTLPSRKPTVFHLLPCHFPLLETGILDYLLERCATPSLSAVDLINLSDADGDTPLHYTALFSGSNNTRAVDRLLRLGAEPGARNVHGLTPGTIRAWAHVCRAKETMAAAVQGRDAGVRWGTKTIQFGIPPRPRPSPAPYIAPSPTRPGPPPPPVAATASASTSFGSSTFEPSDSEMSISDDGDVYWRGHYNGGCSTTYLRLRDAGEGPGEEPVVKIMGQLLRGAKVEEVWDLHAGRWVKLKEGTKAQLVTEADIRADFYSEQVRVQNECDLSSVFDRSRRCRDGEDTELCKSLP